MSTVTCTTCWKPFDAPTTDPTGTCPPCAQLIANAPVPKLGTGFNWKMLGTIVLLSIGGAVAVFVYFWIRAHTGIIGEIRSYADEMCDCRTDACVEDVGNRYNAWVSAHHGELVTDFENLDIVEQSRRVQSCGHSILP